MLNVVIIGIGNISSAHIDSYLKFPNRCKIVALCDIYPEKAQKRANELNLDIEVVDDHRKLLGRDDIDLVSVCTPPYTHAEITCNFLLDEKNVICEKPMASSLAECDLMLEAERKSGKTLSVIAQNRFRDPIMHLKQTLESQKIGKVLHAQVNSHWWRGHCYYDLWWRGTWEKEGGGCTLNHAVHHIDMLSWMLGLPAQVTAVMANVAHDNAEVEDLSIAILEYDKGTIGQITSSVIHHGEEQKIIFQGEKAKISAPWSVFASTSRSNGFPEKNEALEKEITEFYQSLPALEYEGHEGQIDNVITAIENDTRPLVGGLDGKNTLQLITAIYKASSTNSKVSLPLEKDDAFYTVEGIRKHATYFYEKTGNIENMDDSKITVGSDYKENKK